MNGFKEYFYQGLREQNILVNSKMVLLVELLIWRYKIIILLLESNGDLRLPHDYAMEWLIGLDGLSKIYAGNWNNVNLVQEWKYSRVRWKFY